ncbi:MAG TPA: T9SS type A sorting domain-containing protein [Saprospiraceae bacterium]|nr:T9SS type A sorting domain-containing protein [Saprospiraceae bacterium]
MRFCTLFFFWILIFDLSAQSLYFPPTVGDTWETVTPEELSWCTDSIQPLYDFLEAEETKAFIVLKDGKMVMEKYFGGFTQNSPWYWASAGKSLTAFLVGLAQQQGSLSIEDQTSMYLGQGWTSCDSLAENQRTIRHQLTMTTGFDDANFDCLEPSCLNCIAEAGERWAYHNSPYTLLDSVLFYSTGLDATNFVKEHLKDQTGITGAYIKTGNNHVFYSRPRKMARFGLLMLNHGQWDQTPVMTDTNYYHDMIHSSQDLNPSYGYLWWLNGQAKYMLPQSQIVFSGPIMPNAPEDMYAALGKNGQLLNVVPSENLVVVRMGQSTGQFLVETQLNDKIWEYLNAIRCQPTAIKSSHFDKDIRLSPNPTHDKITIRSESHSAPADVKIFNAQGQPVFAKAYNLLNNSELDVSFLPKGIYFVEIYTSGSYGLQKLVRY